MSLTYKPYLPWNDGDLLAWIQNFLTQGNAHIADLPLTAAQLVELNDLMTDYSVAVGDHVAAYSVARSKTIARDVAKDPARTLTRQLAQLVRNSPTTPDAIKELLWLKSPDAPAAPGEPHRPEDFIALGFEQGYNNLKWSKSDNPSNTVYVIEVRTREPIGAWTYVDTTSKTRYRHSNQTPGVPLDYRVRALRAGIHSVFSSISSVYAANQEPAPQLTLEEAA